jgi:hypothetical protein
MKFGKRGFLGNEEFSTIASESRYEPRAASKQGFRISKPETRDSRLYGVRK